MHYEITSKNLTFGIFQNFDNKSRSSSSEEEIELQTKKKKKSRSIREDDLSKEERTRSEVIANLVAMYKCDVHTTSCFIQDGRHLQLNPSRLQLWARDIVCQL